MTHRPSGVSEGHGSKGPKVPGDLKKTADNDGRNYKLIIDPALGQGREKILRYNGCLPGGETSSVKVVDPRPRLSRFGINRHNVNLKVPEFKIDQHYVGKILPKEVSLTNLNNNINQSFLHDMCKVFGDIRTASILYHPKTKKHLGIAKVVFSSSSAAQKCIEKLDQTSKMGNIISVFADPSGEIRKKLFDELTAEKASFRPPSPKERLPANIMEDIKAAPSTSFRAPTNGLRFPDKSASSHAGNFSGPRQPPLPPSPPPPPRSYPDLNLRVLSNSSASSENEFRSIAMQREYAGSVHRDSKILANCGDKDSANSSSLGSSGDFEKRFSSRSGDKPEVSSDWRHCSSRSQRRSSGSRKSFDVHSQSNSQDGSEFQRLNSIDENSGKNRFFDHSISTLQSSVQHNSFSESKNSPDDLFAVYNRSNSLGQFLCHRNLERLDSSVDVLGHRTSDIVSPSPSTNNSGFTPNFQDSIHLNSCARNSGEEFERLDSRLSVESLNSDSDLRMSFIGQLSIKQSHGRDDVPNDEAKKQTRSESTENENLGNFFARANSVRENRYNWSEKQTRHENLDYRKSVSHDGDGRSSYRHGSHRRSNGRHGDRSRESSRRRHYRHKKHRSKHSSSNFEDVRSKQCYESSEEDRANAVTENLERTVSAETAVVTGSSIDAGLVDTDAELHDSLESRIQALLGQAEEINSRNSLNGISFRPPPLPPELPPSPPPLPPAEAEIPPFPPDEIERPVSRPLGGVEMEAFAFPSLAETTLNPLASKTITRLMDVVPGFNSSDAQLGNFPPNSQFIPEVPRPSYHSYFDYNHQPSPREICRSLLHPTYAALPMASDTGHWPLPPPVAMARELHVPQFVAPNMFALAEEKFRAVLDEVTCQLRKVIIKDMQKKMVENIGFRVYEEWWKKEEDSDKVNKQLSSLSSLNQKLLAPITSTPSEVSVTTTSANSASVTKPYDTNVMLSSLFDNKDGSRSSYGAMAGSGFGGGLLGLRGAVAKMPSFRRKLPSPEKDLGDTEIEKSENEEEEGEEQEMTFRGPRTPEQSENDEKESTLSSSSSSLGNENDLNSNALLSKMRLSRSEVVYSSSSDNSSLSEEEEEEDEEEEEASEDNEEEEELKVQTERSKNEEQQLQVVTDIHGEETLMEDEIQKKTKSSDYPLISEQKVEEIESYALSATEMEVDSKRESSSAYYDSLTEPVDVSSRLISTNITRDEEVQKAKYDSKADATAVATALHEQRAAVEEDAGDIGEKTLASLPAVGSTELVVEWLLATSLDHPYCLTSTPDSRNRRGRHSRVHFAISDSAADSDPSDDTVSLSDNAIGLVMTLPPSVVLDHNYCQPYFPVSNPDVKSDSDNESSTSLERVAILNAAGELLTIEDIPDISMEVEITEQQPCDPYVSRKRKRFSDVTSFPLSRELTNILPPVVAKPDYVTRNEKAELEILYEFLSKGLDFEDLTYLKKQYDDLVQEDFQRAYWVNETHWVNHPPTFEISPPPRKRSRSSKRGDCADHHYHATGSARTEGYYKISSHVKSLYLRHTRAVDDGPDNDQSQEMANDVVKKKSQQSRDVRSESRRWQNLFATDLGDEIGDILKFNKLEIRKKQLKFARSRIHDWGLFAMEPIAEGEMVIEYVGQVVRRSVADVLERRYEAVGIGSSYLFRVDHDVIIDATKQGNLSRFINHSCSPNCYAKIITVDSEKKIVIYSKRDIQINEEITYDYKFPLEDEKIPCLCGTSGCRGTLN